MYYLSSFIKNFADILYYPYAVSGIIGFFALLYFAKDKNEKTKYYIIGMAVFICILWRFLLVVKTGRYYEALIIPAILFTAILFYLPGLPLYVSRLCLIILCVCCIGKLLLFNPYDGYLYNACRAIKEKHLPNNVLVLNLSGEGREESIRYFLADPSMQLCSLGVDIKSPPIGEVVKTLLDGSVITHKNMILIVKTSNMDTSAIDKLSSERKNVDIIFKSPVDRKKKSFLTVLYCQQMEEQGNEIPFGENLIVNHNFMQVEKRSNIVQQQLKQMLLNEGETLTYALPENWRFERSDSESAGKMFLHEKKGLCFTGNNNCLLLNWQWFPVRKYTFTVHFEVMKPTKLQVALIPWRGRSSPLRRIPILVNEYLPGESVMEKVTFDFASLSDAKEFSILLGIDGDVQFKDVGLYSSSEHVRN